MLQPKGKLLISCIDPAGSVRTRDVANRVALLQSAVMWRSPDKTKIEFVPTSWIRTKVTRTFRWLGRWIRRQPILAAPVAVVVGPLLVLIGFFVNSAVKPVARLREKTEISSLLISIEASALEDHLELFSDGITQADLSEARELAARQAQLDNP
jgi:hypothetical protein